jgi:predicted AlkP superfamily pyrophosphatase or phosphodiesterase
MRGQRGTHRPDDVLRDLRPWLSQSHETDQSERLLRDEKLLTVAGGNIVDAKVHCLPMGGSAGLYVLDATHRAEIVNRLLPRLRALEGIEAVLDEKDLSRLGQALPANDRRVPDFMVAAREGYTFAGRVPGPEPITTIKGTKGAHGHLPTPDELQASFFAWGPAIKSGVVLHEIRNVDVAPTIAAVLGVKMPDVDGRVLVELLR